MITLQYLHISVDLWGAFFCLIAVVSILIGKSFDKKGSRWLIALILCSMLLMTSDMLVWLFTGSEGDKAARYVEIATGFTYFFGFLTIPLVAEYLTHLIVSRSNIAGLMWKYVEWVIFGVGAVLIAASLFHGYDAPGTARAQLMDMLPGILGMFGLIISVGVVLEYLKFFIKFEKVAFISYLLLPLIALSVHTFLNKVSFTVLSIVISTLILYFSYVFNSREYRTELERSLADQQIRMFHHQIQPHFVFNSLAVIKYQCRKSPEEAIGTIDEFSDYLRGCTDMMSSADCVGVERELDLIRHYINLQKKRFSDRFDYIAEIEDTDFEIPPFTILTCVENALKHGLRGQANENEYVRVRTYRGRSAHVIEIEDNGAGFDTRTLEDLKGEKHIGIKNTDERIRIMCGGDFHIDSAAGKGTKVTITIPGNRKEL